MTVGPNRDDRVVADFGREWATYDQSELPAADRQEMFGQYFAVFPWDQIAPDAVGADIGCGSGRWAALVAPRAGRLHCVDASEQALSVARRNLAGARNVEFHCASVDDLPFDDATLDFGYSLGVLHHVPDTAAALRSCARILRPGAPFLVYLYYAFDNQPSWYRAVWRLSDVVRRLVAVAPHRLAVTITSIVAGIVYLPLARLAALAEALGHDVTSFPLAYYRRRTFYVMRTDALDRFGTRLEHRYTRSQVLQMLTNAGFADVVFHDDVPYWTACAIRR